MDKTDKTPIYQLIFNDLLKDIKDGTYKIGDQIPTEKELMSRYNTSRITVARAVSELKNRNYIHRQKGTGSFVAQKSMWDSQNRIQNSNIKPTIAAVIPSPSSNLSIELEVLQGIIKTSNEMGYAITIYSNESESSNEISPREFEKNLITDLIKQGVVGVIIFPCTENETPEIYNLMTRKSLPYVILDRAVFGVEAPLVTSENRKGFYSIVEYIISKGHNRIAFFSGNTYESSCRTDRFYGYVKALNDYQIDIDDNLIEHHLFPENFNNRHYKNLEEKNDKFTCVIKEKITELMSLEEPPTVIVATNDYLVASIVNILNVLGYSIPKDISIAGFDGLISNLILTPKVTTVSQDFLRMGKEAIVLLDKIIRNPHRAVETVNVPTELQIGDSVRQL